VKESNAPCGKVRGGAYSPGGGVSSRTVSSLFEFLSFYSRGGYLATGQILLGEGPSPSTRAFACPGSLSDSLLRENKPCRMHPHLKKALRSSRIRGAPTRSSPDPILHLGSSGGGRVREAERAIGSPRALCRIQPPRRERSATREGPTAPSNFWSLIFENTRECCRARAIGLPSLPPPSCQSPFCSRISVVSVPAAASTRLAFISSPCPPTAPS